MNGYETTMAEDDEIGESKSHQNVDQAQMCHGKTPFEQCGVRAVAKEDCARLVVSSRILIQTFGLRHNLRLLERGIHL